MGTLISWSVLSGLWALVVNSRLLHERKVGATGEKRSRTLDAWPTGCEVKHLAKEFEICVFCIVKTPQLLERKFRDSTFGTPCWPSNVYFIQRSAHNKIETFSTVSIKWFEGVKIKILSTFLK